MRIILAAKLALLGVLVGLICSFSHTLSLEISDAGVKDPLEDDWWEDSVQSGKEGVEEDSAPVQPQPVVPEAASIETDPWDFWTHNDRLNFTSEESVEPEPEVSIAEAETINHNDTLAQPASTFEHNEPYPRNDININDAYGSASNEAAELGTIEIEETEEEPDLPKTIAGNGVGVTGVRNDSGGLITSDIMIESPPVTNWGEWGPVTLCPEGKFAAGFSLKTEEDQGKGDDTAMNGIKLICIPPGSNDFDGPNATEIASWESEWGSWGRKFYCDKGVVTGFQLRTEKHLGRVEKAKRKIKKGFFGWTRSADDTAANNLRLFCSNLGDKGFLEGDGHSWGRWTEPQKCLSQQAVCGIQTQNEVYQGDGDDTALNNVRMKCCTLPNLGAKCDPSDKWETILECDNSYSKEPLTCTYQKSRGVSRSSSSSEALWYEFSTMLDLGFTSNLIYNGLNMNFRYNLSQSEATGYEWRSESGETFSEVVTTMAEFTVPGGMKSRLSQAVGACGVFNVHTNFFRKQDCLPGTDIVVQESLFLDE